MSRSGRGKGWIFGLCVAALSLVASVAPSQAAQPSKDDGPRVPNINWSPCFADVQAELASFLPPEAGPPTFECAVVPVPLDYDSRKGGSVPLSLVRLPALDPDAKIGSLFLNPGGPGGSGVEFAVFGATFLYSPELRSQFDLIGFDPRGIARSTALKCFGNLDQAFGIFESGVVAFPKTDAEVQQWFADDQKLADACDRRGNKVLDHMSTANVARDLDLLREAVGDEQLTYAGYSYGSYLGATYANLFPENVRAVIVDGVLDPIAWSTGYSDQEGQPFSSRLNSDDGAQATLEEFFGLCDAAGPELCAFAPDSSERYEDLAAELLANEPFELEIPVGPDQVEVVPFFYGDLIGFSLGAMYDSSSWFFFAMDLAFIESNVFGGLAAPSPGLTVGGQGNLGYTSKSGFPRYMNVLEGFPAVACADSDNPGSSADWVAAAGDVSSDNYFTQLWTFASSPCLAFPADDADRYVGPFDAETANPVLVASTMYDPATPVAGAISLDGLLPNSRLLLVDGWGHTTLGISSCASFFSEQYLITQVLPPEGSICPQDFNPFELFGGPGPDAAQLRVQELRSRFLGGN